MMFFNHHINNGVIKFPDIYYVLNMRMPGKNVANPSPYDFVYLLRTMVNTDI
jgi:hypothetical protein